ncbi:PorV/PorQ family protein [Flavobacterium restrictum]|uniref:Aromatic hydrocarbon degradation protein n=1 Tax=Flavobacterium restrictum TaxID=2594428 RepID=A0A553EBQ6_9FLAO|nr:aromatic hydrocarbon degradation protein [Flavobacterium restrictum]TRX42371.1 aromatic hydrocarbon degradation protein [Flavobacterium restrictum]
MKTTLLFLSLFFCVISTSFSQSISSSPYSIYGLGTLYDADLGTIPSIGGSGIALPSTQFINNLNPASLAFMYHNHFLFDVGGKSIFSTYQNSDKKESRNNIQFSHIAFAFPITSKSAFSATLKPYSSTAYKISNLTLPILNSVENYNLSVTGTGGLNNFDLSYGYLVSKKLALGLTTSLLFGNATDNRSYTIANAVSYINKKTNYNGVRATLGAQFQADSTLTIGIIAKTPTRINASKIQTVASTNSSSTITLESDLASNVDDFYMPLEAGIGFSKAFKNKLNVTLDYERGFWQSTKQSDIYGSFVDRDKISLGFTYKRPKLFGSYFNRIQYAAGLNYDTGYLEVDSHRVINKSFSVGVSLPIDNTFSALNISYSYGQKAKISDGLIKENYHKISINLCLDGIWFVKRKFE